MSPGVVASVGAPILNGFSTACWSWTRQFQCIETNPKLFCDSGDPYATVQSSCSLTAAAINSSVTVKGLTYITDATYNYQCAFGNYTTNDSLPTGKDCTMLKSTTVDSNPVPAAPPGTTPSTGSGNPPTTAPLTGSIPTTETRTDQYVCYSQPQTTCSDTCYQQVVDPTTGKISQQTVPCTSPVTNCVTSSSQCGGTITPNGDGSSSASAALGPDGRCIDSTVNSMCQAGPVPKCLTKENCTLSSSTDSSVASNGVGMTQQQSYICSNTVKSCSKYADISNCVHANAWGWDNMSIKGQVGQGLGEYNQAMAKLEGIQKGMTNNDPYIFSGKNLTCHYAVGNFLNTFITIAIIVATMVMTGGASAGLLAEGLQMAGMAAEAANAAAIAIEVGASFASDAPNSKALGSDCCKDYVIQGSDAWYKLGACTGDEVKLAVAKQKGLYHYLGEYCSKKSGFPIRQCVEMTKSYCVFDDMLALVVNEQGRAQLDAVAAADTSTAKASGALPFQLYTPASAVPPNPTKYTGVLNTGAWHQLTVTGNSQIWGWQYPSYCVSKDAQTAAYNLYTNELNAVLSTNGIQPGSMTKQQALQLLKNAITMPAFQECPSTPGLVSFMTCSKTDDSCDPTKLPEGPTGVEVDLSGANVSQADVNWRVQQVQSFHQPGDYGVTSSMPTDSTFAAVSDSVNEFITSTGSCHTDGSCLYSFAVTDKLATGGLGARKRTTDYAQFPLYTIVQTSAWPAIDYLAQDGTLDTQAYQADPNRGLGTPLMVSTQRFLFHPNFLSGPQKGNIHSAVLLEWATKRTSDTDPRADFTPLLVPTSLPPATATWFPHGDVTDNSQHFFLSGGCDPNSRWCNYRIDVDLNVPRHPWGSPQQARCWGFSLEQMAALDFNKMDLSRWINSLDLGDATNGLSASAASAMSAQVTASAQNFYTAVNTGAAINKPNPGAVALVTNTDILPKMSNDAFKAYTLQAAVPANWPNWFDDQPNVNPVTNVRVDWGDGSTTQLMPKDVGGRAYMAEHDYGDKPVGTYKVTVTLDTAANGSQTLTTNVRITPDAGSAPASTPVAGSNLDFNNPGVDGKSAAQYSPSTTLNGSSQAPTNLQQTSPGTAQQFNQQGSSITTK